jgi:hypothetical protein
MQYALAGCEQLSSFAPLEQQMARLRAAASTSRLFAGSCMRNIWQFAQKAFAYTAQQDAIANLDDGRIRRADERLGSY